MAITNTGVTVTFPALKKDVLGHTVEVKDADGKVYAVKTADLAEGAKSYTFEFATTVPTEKLVGVWTVDGVSFDLDLATNLKAFNDANTQIALNKALNDLGIKNVKVENVKNYTDAQPAFLAKLAADNKELSVANIQAFVDKINSESITAEESKVIAKKVTDAKTAGNDVALLQALKDPAFVRVNSEWLTSYKSGIVAASDDTVEKIQAKINSANDTAVGLTTDTGIVKKDLLEAKDLVVNYNTPDTKGEQTTATKTKLDKINTQLALVDVLEATTPNNFKAKLATLANLVNTSGSTVIDMKKYVDANGQAYIDALKAPGLADTSKDTVTKLEQILFASSTGVNDKESDKLIAAVNTQATASTVDADKLLKSLKDLGIKQADAINKEKYKADKAGFATAAGSTKTKVAVQVQTDASNLAAVGAQTTEEGILEKLSVFGLDNVVASNAAEYLAAKAAIAGVTPNASGNNAETVKLVKAQVEIVNEAVTETASVVAINKATTVTEVKSALDKLAITSYVNVSSADKLYIAEQVFKLVEAEENNSNTLPFANKAAITSALDTATTGVIAKYRAMVVEFNYSNLSDIATTITQLDKLEYAPFDNLSAGKKANVAEAFKANYPQTEAGAPVNYTTLAAVKAGIDKAIQAVAE